MRGEPAVAVAQEFRHLVVAAPVVLVVVEHRHEHEMTEELMDRQRGFQFDPVIRALAPLGKGFVQRQPRGVDLIAERLEELPQKFLAAAAGQGGQGRTQGKRAVHQLRSLLALPRQCAAEHLRYGHAEKRRRGVRPVVHILLQRAALTRRPAPIPHQPDRVHLHQQRYRTARRFSLGIKGMGRAERQFKRLRARRILADQMPQVRRRPMRGGEGEEHGRRLAGVRTNEKW